MVRIESKTYTITLNEEQLKLVSRICDIVSRLQCCQFERLTDLVEPSQFVDDPNFKRLHKVQKELNLLKIYFGLSPSASYGIYSEKVNTSARTLWDIHQVIRHYLAYQGAPGVTQENRWKHHKFTVNFDEPRHSDKSNELIKIEEVK